MLDIPAFGDSLLGPECWNLQKFLCRKMLLCPGFVASFRDGGTTLKIEFAVCEGEGMRAESKIVQKRCLSWESILKAHILLSRNFVAIAQAPRVGAPNSEISRILYFLFIYIYIYACRRPRILGEKLVLYTFLRIPNVFTSWLDKWSAFEIPEWRKANTCYHELCMFGSKLQTNKNMGSNLWGWKCQIQSMV